MSNDHSTDQPNSIFYLYSQDGTDSEDKAIFDKSSAVPAKFLLRNGKKVQDPYPGGSNQQNLYARLNTDGTIDQSSRFENAGNYLIVPASVDTSNPTNFAAAVDNAVAAGSVAGSPVSGFGAGAILMVSGFSIGGSEDYQRGSEYGIPANEVGAAFKDSTSENLGYVTALTAFPNASAEIGGGLLNESEYKADQTASWLAKWLLGIKLKITHKKPDGPFWMDQADALNFDAGVKSARQQLTDDATRAKQISTTPTDPANAIYDAVRAFSGSVMGDLHRAARAIRQHQSISVAPIQKNHNNQRAAASTQFNPAETSNDGRRALSIDEVLTITKQAQAYMETLPVPPSVLKEIALSHLWINNRPPPPPWLDTRPKRTLDDGQRDPNTPLSVHDILAIGRAARDNDRPNGYAPAAPSQCYPQSAMQMSFAPVRRPERAPARPSMAQPAGEETSRRNDGAPFGVPHPITQEEFREALSKHLDRESRLPPSGPAGFDPRLSPAWPGLKSAN